MGDFLANLQSIDVSIVLTMTVLGLVMALGGRFLASRSGRFSQQSIRTMSEWILAQSDVPPDLDAAQAEALARQTFAHIVWLLTGSGVAFAVASAGLTVFSLTVSHASDSFDSLFAIAISVSLLIGFVTGSVGGHFLSMRKNAGVSPAHTSPLRPMPHQSVFGYVSAALLVASLVSYGFVAVLDYEIAIQLPPVTFDAFGTARVWPSIAVGIAEALITLAIPVIALACAQWIAWLPSPQLEHAPPRDVFFARYLRTRTICWLIFLPLACWFSALLFAKVNAPYNARSGLIGFVNIAFQGPWQFMACMLLFYLAPMAIIYPGIASGRMGGRLTGWWWQRRPAAREQEGVEGA